MCEICSKLTIKTPERRLYYCALYQNFVTPAYFPVASQFIITITEV